MFDRASTVSIRADNRQLSEYFKMKKPLSYPPPPETLRKGSLGNYLKYFGPGAIIASVTIGSGETVFASRGGAVFGYALLWCFVGGGIMKFVQVYTAARYMTLTGEHPIERWKYLPGPRGWAVWVLAVGTILCFPLWLSGLPKMLGSLTVWIFDLGQQAVWGDERVWGTAFVLVAIAITMIQSYALLERVQTVIVGILLLSILVAVFVAKPDWLSVLYGTFVPSMPAYQSWLFEKYPVVSSRSPWIEVGIYLGAIGGGTQDYFGYIGMLREKAWGLLGRSVKSDAGGVRLNEDSENFNRGRIWLRAPLIDSLGSFGCVVIFTMAFTVLGAVVLHPQQIVPSGLQLLSRQAEFLTQMHPQLLYLYQAGVFIAFIGTIIGAYELYVRTTRECLQPLVQKIRDLPLPTLRIWVVAYCGIGGVVIMWIGGNPVEIVTPAAIFGGVLTCGLWCLLMVWTDRKFLPRELQMNPILLVLNLVSGIFLLSWGIRSGYEFVNSLAV